MIPFNRATFDGKELAYLAQAVADGHVSGNGPFTRRAEAALEVGHGTGRTLLTTSCTHALEMAALLGRFAPGDEVIVPAYTFVSTASAFLLHGATPVFVDVRPDTLNLCPDLVEAAITERTRAICIVHYGGVGATPRRFREVADRHGLLLVEDNAHGLFGVEDGGVLGTFGHLSTLSFHETKNVTCGEGGALHGNDPVLVERAEILREKGTDRSRFLRGQVDKYTWVDVGSSWVLSDLLAGVLVGQLERFEDLQARRHAIPFTTRRRPVGRRSTGCDGRSTPRPHRTPRTSTTCGSRRSRCALASSLTCVSVRCSRCSTTSRCTSPRSANVSAADPDSIRSPRTRATRSSACRCSPA